MGFGLEFFFYFGFSGTWGSCWLRMSGRSFLFSAQRLSGSSAERCVLKGSWVERLSV